MTSLSAKKYRQSAKGKKCARRYYLKNKGLKDGPWAKQAAFRKTPEGAAENRRYVYAWRKKNADKAKKYDKWYQKKNRAKINARRRKARRQRRIHSTVLKLKKIIGDLTIV